MSRGQRETSRYLVDNGLVVEQVAGSRKMRHIFLFNDIFICARQKVSGRYAVFDHFLFLQSCWRFGLLSDLDI